MKQYSILQAVYMSFFSKGLYQDVRKNWRGKAFIYLFILAAVLIIPMMIKIHLGIAGFMGSYAPNLIQQIPEIKIHNGQVSTPEAKKYVIKDPDNGKPFAVIDTTGKTETLDPDTYALLTKDKLIIKQERRNEIKTYGLEEVKDFALTQADMLKWSDLIKTWLALAIYPFILLFFWVWYMIQSLLYGLAGILISKLTKEHFSYESVCRLASVAMTPAIIIGTAINAATITVTYWVWISIGITLAYLVLAIVISARNKDAIKPEKVITHSQKNTPAAVKKK